MHASANRIQWVVAVVLLDTKILYPLKMIPSVEMSLHVLMDFEVFSMVWTCLDMVVSLGCSLAPSYGAHVFDVIGKDGRREL